MKVYERLAHAFKAEGTTATFGMMGDGNMYWIYALDRLGVKVHEVRHEGAGLGMADGYARTTHTPGVATATCGPGVTQLATALVTASRAHSPLVAFCGESPTTTTEYTQYLDQSRFAAACESGFVRLQTPDQADDVVRKAFYLAKTENRPVMLSCPMDIQQKKFEDDDEAYKPSSTLFTRGAVHPDAKALEQAADMVAGAKKPVIIVGRGAQWAGAGPAVLKLGDRIGALISDDAADEDLPQRVRVSRGHLGLVRGSRPAMHLAHEGDLVIGVGASLNRHTLENGYMYPEARYVHIDSQPHLMMGGGRAADLLSSGGCQDRRRGTGKTARQANVKLTGYRTPDVKAKLVNHNADRTEFEMDPGTVDPREAVIALDQLVPPEIGVLSGSGMTSAFCSMLMTRRRALVQGGHFFGCIGQMLPAAMGAVVATGNAAMLLDGDASVMMHLAEFETAVRYNMPLLVIVMNNEALGAEYYKLDAHKMEARARRSRRRTWARWQFRLRARPHGANHR